MKNGAAKNGVAVELLAWRGVGANMEKSLFVSKTMPVASAGRRAFIAKLALASLAAAPALVLPLGAAEPAKSGAKPAKPSSPAPSAGSWLTDVNRATTEAKKFNKHLLINFTGSDWCPDCMHLEKYVLSTPEFKQYARENLVLLKVDFPRKRALPPAEKARNERMAKQYEIGEFPTLVLLKSDGEELGRTGLDEEWVKWIADRKDNPKIVKACLERLDAIKKGEVFDAVDRWLTDYALAVKIAKAKKKRIFLYFTGSDWCPYCVALHKETLSSREFIEYARKEFVLVKLDFPRTFSIPEETKKQNAALQQKYQVNGLPCTIILSPNEERLSDPMAYCKKEDYMRWLKAVRKK